MAQTNAARAIPAQANPLNTEYRLFGQVTGALLDAQRQAPRGASFIDAVDWNRQLWSALASDCLDDANRLPKEMRTQIVSLSLWVAKYSREVTRQGASVDPLIAINRSIMSGLSTA
jgi:flagellar protein FlaF